MNLLSGTVDISKDAAALPNVVVINLAQAIS
jgi:hypothetical protein